MMTVEIDKYSGFCGGVIRAIGKAETYLEDHKGENLYSLGSIVHNEAELARLSEKGLIAVDGNGEMEHLVGKTVLIRAHGEPPEVYRRAERLGIELIDCTCPVVLQLQKRIRDAHVRLNLNGRRGQIIIFGKEGHAEVLGLVGQVGGDALVIESVGKLRDAIAPGQVRLGEAIEVFSQTTKSPAEYAEICAILEDAMAKAHELSIERFKGRGLLTVHNTICSQVASRHAGLSEFALGHDIVIFVSGKESSNGKVLFELCRSLNERTFRVGTEDDIDASWFLPDDKVGVCGATSTPKWLLEAVAQKILHLN